MADIFNNEKRSEIMRKVKSKKNKSTELRLIDIFKQNGITGWKRNYPVKGHPDFVFLSSAYLGMRIKKEKRNYISRKNSVNIESFF